MAGAMQGLGEYGRIRKELRVTSLISDATFEFKRGGRARGRANSLAQRRHNSCPELDAAASQPCHARSKAQMVPAAAALRIYDGSSAMVRKRGKEAEAGWTSLQLWPLARSDDLGGFATAFSISASFLSRARPARRDQKTGAARGWSS